MSKHIAPYGSWRSPISAETLSSATVGFSEVQPHGDHLYWLESRPQQKGRTTIMRLTPNGEREELLPPPFNARSRINEYGGGSYCLGAEHVYFVRFDDQRIYAKDIKASQEPRALSTEGQWRFGDLVWDEQRNRLLAICEDHHKADQEEESFLAALNLDGTGTPKKLHSGHDFYASPTISPDGKQIAWLCWNHPNMPWDGCECWLGEFDEAGNIINAKRIAGGPRESIFQPQWSPDGELYLISDRSNWWNLYRWQQDELTPVCEQPFEFGTPQWVFRLSTYCFLDAERVLATYTQNGVWRLGVIHVRDGHLETIDSPCTDLSYLRAGAGDGYFIGASPHDFPALWKVDGKTAALYHLASSGELPVAKEYIAAAEAIEFPVGNGAQTGYAFFYPPTNKDFVGPDGSLPPLLVLCHGGPTSATRNSLNFKIQYWTSRGFAVADVNYGGSTGFGREYRDRLKGQWGMVDVQDAVDCVRYLVDQQRVDGSKVAIRGSSAGGYTVLAALTFHDVFRAGASLYGIGDLETLATDTHKFESRYLDQLVGPYPEQKETYRERSPIHHVKQLNCPVIFLQGLQDKIVPPNQAEAMVSALDEKKLPVAYVTFEEEAHGFRQAASIIRAQEAELYFYSRVFGFELAEPITPITIRNEEYLGAGN